MGIENAAKINGQVFIGSIADGANRHGRDTAFAPQPPECTLIPSPRHFPFGSALPFRLAVATNFLRSQKDIHGLAPQRNGKIKKIGVTGGLAALGPECFAASAPQLRLPGFRRRRAHPRVPRKCKHRELRPGSDDIALTALSPPMPVSKTVTSFGPMLALNRSNSRRFPNSQIRRGRRDGGNTRRELGFDGEGD